ncbi:hypothetical protein ACO0LG_14775 [Undibacterium sp. Ji42W]|uniref:hypothetical protein n=1 Tax=Undibacterium sp. Ji42W TaxID=3413039 RepID=UPI003BF2A791
MASKARVSLVLLSYLLLGGVLLALPVLLLMVKNIAYRFEILAGFYILLFFAFVIRSFMLGGGLDLRLTTQVNEAYGASLKNKQGWFIDLQCMSLLRIFGVWLVFPAAWSSKIIQQADLFVAYELSLDAWIANAPATHQAREEGEAI